VTAQSCTLCVQDNDILLCDGPCDRAYHQFCLPVPPTAAELEDDSGWLCPACATKARSLAIPDDVCKRARCRLTQQAGRGCCHLVLRAQRTAHTAGVLTAQVALQKQRVLGALLDERSGGA